MDRKKFSRSAIKTDGLTGCFGFLLDGAYDGKPFCYLHHNSWAPNPAEQLSSEELLANQLHELALSLKEALREWLLEAKEATEASDAEILSMSCLSLVVAGGDQQDNDEIREAFALLQAGPLSSAVVDRVRSEPVELHLLEQLHRKVTIIDAVGYFISDDQEEDVADAGRLIAGTDLRICDNRFLS